MIKRIVFLVPMLVLIVSCAPDPTSVAINEQIQKDIDRVSKCADVRNKADEIDNSRAELVSQAKELQRNWIKEEMLELNNSGRISDDELEIFNNQIRTDVPPKPAFPGSDIYELMNKLVVKGYIKPYLPKEVVAIGESVALSPSSASYKIGFPECFSDLENEMFKSLSELKPSKGVWASKKSPMELIP
jgi:hypothetical protein